MKRYVPMFVIVMMIATAILSACAAPAPQVVTVKETVVVSQEKIVQQTVVVEKEKVVQQTVVVREGRGAPRRSRRPRCPRRPQRSRWAARSTSGCPTVGPTRPGPI